MKPQPLSPEQEAEARKPTVDDDVWSDELVRRIWATLDASRERTRELKAALRGLESRYEPGVFCDHAAAPCHRCDAARAALAGVPR
jgi:hypothetical protein